MSSSALIAAKKRLETSLKKYEFPTTTEPITTHGDSGVLLLSLITSRLHWTSSVFSKYKADNVQQPKRNNNSRKKWPNMKSLGTGTLKLGPHVFAETTFYLATRSISWLTIAKQQGLIQEQDTLMAEATAETTVKGEGSTEPLVEEGEKLTFTDFVFELPEIPNERFIFPKEALISLSVEDGPIVVHASFMLPIDTTDYFFESPKDLILKFGSNCQVPCIHKFYNSNNTMSTRKRDKDTTVYRPTNIQILHLDQAAIDALEDTIEPAAAVKEILANRLKSAPKQTYIKYDLSDDPENQVEVQELLKRSLTVPEITSGPIMAERKRNEVLNAIKLGKRARDEKYEAELVKNKQSNHNAKDDGLLKCAYCSTKHTAMWRPGPGGQGTLCNSCGIQWKRGEILKGAPVISPQEERRLLRERREREKAAEMVELEKVDRESKKAPKRVERQSVQDLDTTNKKSVVSRPMKSNNNLLTKPSMPEPAVAAETVFTTSEKAKNITVTTPTKTASPSDGNVKVEAYNTPCAANQASTAPATSQQQQQNNSFFLYSQGGIPLPTLSIDFVNLFQFAHPNCAVTLLDGFFHIRLCTAKGEQSLINLEKSDLINSQFEISHEGEGATARELLTMTIPPLSKSIHIFQQILPPSSNIMINIRFLEKLDPTGGAVVQRILQRWLVTVPQS